MAADALGLDPFNLSSDDLSYLAVFHALGHSIHSLDSFFSAIANVYKDLGKVLPRDHLFLATKRGLKRVFNPIDKILRAYPLSFDQVRLILSLLDSTSFDDVVFGFWLSLSFVWALRPDDWIHGRLTWGDIARRLDGGTQLQFTLARARYTMVRLRGNCLRSVLPLASTRRIGSSA